MDFLNGSNGNPEHRHYDYLSHEQRRATREIHALLDLAGGSAKSDRTREKHQGDNGITRYRLFTSSHWGSAASLTMPTVGKMRHHVHMAARGEPLKSKAAEEVVTIVVPPPATAIGNAAVPTGGTTGVQRLLPSGDEAGTPPEDRAFSARHPRTTGSCRCARRNRPRAAQIPIRRLHWR